MYSPILQKVNNKYGNNVWEAYSPKLKRNVHLYSDLEYDHWILVESDQSIEMFCEQPLSVEMPYHDMLCSSIFDMWISRNEQETFFEVKYSNDLDMNSKNYEHCMKQISIQKSWCIANGYTHQVITEKEIRSNPVFLSNMKLVIKSSVHHFKSEPIRQMIQISNLINDEQVPIRLISDILSSQIPDVIRIILLMIYRGKIAGDFDQYPITLNSIISLKK